MLRALGIEVTPGEERDALPVSASPTECTAWEALSGEELSADELVGVTGLATAEALGALAALEMRGIVELRDDGRYARSR